MTVIKIGYYKKTDWDKLLQIIEDVENMHTKWEDWLEAYSKLKKDLTQSGHSVKAITVDLDKLVEYCEKNGLKNIGATRSQFIQQS